MRRVTNVTDVTAFFCSDIHARARMSAELIVLLVTSVTLGSRWWAWRDCSEEHSQFGHTCFKGRKHREVHGLRDRSAACAQRSGGVGLVLAMVPIVAIPAGAAFPKTNVERESALANRRTVAGWFSFP